MNEYISKYQNDLNENGFFKTHINLSSAWSDFVLHENWELLDHEVELFLKDSELVNILKSFCSFTDIEHIISIRDASNPWEEDGIWHDDGSRKLAFSLSLTKNSSNIQGGVLEIRKKGESISQKIPPFEWGEVVIFKTGISHFEHKINQVTSGRRIIIAGWCS